MNPSTLLNGQGINVSSLVQQILSESSGQLTQWEGEQTTLQSQASDITAINNDLSTLATAVQALDDPVGVLTALTASSSDNNVLTASTTGSAVAATHQIEVNSLATNGLIYTNDFAAGANASILPTGETTGEIDLQVGGGTPVPITITAGSNDTLNTLASYINSQNLGVTANVVTDANGARLSLTSQATGTAGALAVTSNDTNLSFVAPSGGSNASLTIDGVPYSSATNTITGAIAGVTLNLEQASPGEDVQLTVGPDATGIEDAVNNFVSAYNQVIGDINQEFTVNSSTNSQGPLGSDAALKSLQTSLLNDAVYSVQGDGGPVNLASFGINMNDDGTLSVGTNAEGQTLAQVLASDPTAFQNFLQNSSATGFADNFNTDLTNLTDPSVGVLNVDLAQNQAEQQDLTNSINNFQTQLSNQQTALTSEFDSVNASLQEYPLLLQQVTETLATLSTNSTGTTSTASSPTLTAGL